MSTSLPPPEEWQSAAESGEAAVRRAMQPVLLSLLDGRHHPATWMAALLGAAHEIAATGRAATGNPAVMEEYLVAHVRGGCRGADGPIHEDGRPFEGTANA